jgi:predicted nucleic acid-binding Zn ribbon protein
MIRVDRVIPDVLAEVIRKAPLCPEKVAFAWREAVGPAIARASSVRHDEQGVLHITADAVWTAEIRRSSKLILARLARLLGTGVVASISTVPKGDPERSRRRTPGG